MEKVRADVKFYSLDGFQDRLLQEGEADPRLALKRMEAIEDQAVELYRMNTQALEMLLCRVDEQLKVVQAIYKSNDNALLWRSAESRLQFERDFCFDRWEIASVVTGPKMKALTEFIQLQFTTCKSALENPTHAESGALNRFSISLMTCRALSETFQEKVPIVTYKLTELCIKIDHNQGAPIGYFQSWEIGRTFNPIRTGPKPVLQEDAGAEGKEDKKPKSWKPVDSIAPSQLDPEEYPSLNQRSCRLRTRPDGFSEVEFE